MEKHHIYVGNTSNKGFYKYKFVKGKLIFCADSHDFERCTYLAKCNKYIFGVLEVKDESSNNGYVVAYTDENNELVNICKEKSYGQGPCHISVSKQKRLIFVSNYVDGHFTIFKMNNDGSIGKKIYNNVVEEKKSHVHCIKMISKNLFCVVDLGISTILLYEIDDGIREVSRLKLGENVEPRHFVVNKNQIIIVTEKTCKLYVVTFKNKNLELVNVYSILPEGVNQRGNYTGCAIKSSKNGKYIYVSIREHNSISVFKKCKKSFKLVQNIASNGNLPWDVEMSKTERYVFVANNNSNNISIFRRNKLNGKIKLVDSTKAESPTCVIAR